MNINGADVKLNVLILSMEHEIDVTVQAIDSLLIDTEDNVTISVLLNGSTSDELRALLSKYPSIKYYESPENLGVAGGRNFLFMTEEFKAADIICILDNDVVAPRDYLKKMATALLSDENIGGGGAVVLDIKQYYSKLEPFKTPRAELKEENYDLTCEDIRAMFFADPSPQNIYHIGIHKNWFITYLTPLPLVYNYLNWILSKFKKKRRYSVTLKNDTKYVDKIVNDAGRFETSNIAGCSLSFRRELADRIGNFDDIFNPYGLEDVDFNVRAKKAGFRNYTLCDVWLLHGTDSRHKQREQEKVLENYYRVLTIFAYKHTPGFVYKYLVLSRIWCNRYMLRLRKNPNDKKYYDAQMRGLRQGLKQLETTLGTRVQ